MLTECEQVAEVVLSEDVDGLVDYVSREYRVRLSDNQAVDIQKKARALSQEGRRDREKTWNAKDRGWHGWNVWLKNRLNLGYGGSVTNSDCVTATLHLFFINGIHETSEMLGRLHNDSFTASNGVAKSKLHAYQASLVPIDKVAARVGPAEFLADKLKG